MRHVLGGDTTFTDGSDARFGVRISWTCRVGTSNVGEKCAGRNAVFSDWCKLDPRLLLGLLFDLEDIPRALFLRIGIVVVEDDGRGEGRKVGLLVLVILGRVWTWRRYGSSNRVVFLMRGIFDMVVIVIYGRWRTRRRCASQSAEFRDWYK